METLSIRTREQVLNVQLLGEGCPQGVAAKDLRGSPWRVKGLQGETGTFKEPGSSGVSS